MVPGQSVTQIKFERNWSERKTERERKTNDKHGEINDLLFDK